MPTDVHAHRARLRHSAYSPSSPAHQVVRGQRSPRSYLLSVIAAFLLIGVVAVPAGAAPVSPKPSSKPASPSSAATTSSPVDPAAPTPTTPPPNGVQQGHGPDGITIGGPALDTQDRVLYDGAPPLPTELNVHALVVADVGTGEILAAQDPHGQYYPASTLKTLTLLALYPHLDPNQVLTATYEDATVEGSRVGVVENGQYTVGQLWSALMLQSGNDAARMLTTAVGGPEKALELMTETALSLQAYDTHPGSTSGLDVAGQSSSPYDLALFMREIVNNPALRSIVAQPLGQLPAQPPKYPAPLSFGNQNHLLLNYPGTIGGKTGFTDAARHTFVAAAERNGRTLVVSLMQAEHQPQPTWKQAAALLDWGFAAPAHVTGAGRLVLPDEISPAPPAKSKAAAHAAAGDPARAGGARAVSPAAASEREPEMRIGAALWPLLVMLGALVIIAIRVAAPRGTHRADRSHH